jgi:hypothetical protein
LVRDVQKFNPLGDPTIETYYHKALEAGRFSEKSIADAQHFLQQKQALLMKHIEGYFHMNSLAVDGQLSDKPRAFKYVIDSINILKTVQAYQKEIIGLVGALTKNIGILSMIEQNMLGVIQQNLNSIAMLMNEICNWCLPKNISLPNILGAGLWRFNGFNFPLSAFKPNLKFDLNFAFSSCKLSAPSVSLGQSCPSSVVISGLSYGSAPFAPPLGGVMPTADQLSDPTFVASLLAPSTSAPVYNPSTNPAVLLMGSVPNPVAIISNYSMPPATYAENIVSILPSTQPLVSDVAPTAATYADLRKLLVQNVTLNAVVASEFEPVLTSTWLLYINSCRTGREGQWLQEFQASYDQWLQPAITELAQTPVPWNNVVDGTGTVAGPRSTLLGSLLLPMSIGDQGAILWKLSYIEAAVLGYPRSTAWDAYSDSRYISSFTQQDLDYSTTVLTSATASISLGANEATYPVTCTYPTAIGNVLQQVIAMADKNIQANSSWKSSQAQLRYTYNQFAEAVEVDRFSQFWREFNSNLATLLVQDPYVVGFVVSYPASLDSAIDPLGDSSIYNRIQTDAATRNRSWTPGTPLLPIPTAPYLTSNAISSYICLQGNTDEAPTNTQYWRPFTPADDASLFNWVGIWGASGVYNVNDAVYYTPTGWTVNQGEYNFDPATFLLRPDVQSLSIPTQMAMLDTNQTYASLLLQQNNISTVVQNAIATSQQQLATFQSFGFGVELDGNPFLVPVGNGIPVTFDTVDFDLTGNVTSLSQFTIQTAGNYAVTGALNWDIGDTGTRSVIVLNGTTVMASASLTGAGPETLSFSANYYCNQGDVITVVASHSLSVGQQVIAGSAFSMMQVSTTADTPVPAQDNTPAPSSGSTTATFTSSEAFPALTVVGVSSTGTIAPIDPTTVQFDSNGNAVYPFSDGVALTASTAAGASVSVATQYGVVYTATGANFTTGGLLYATVGGALTQDFSNLTTSVQWVVCVGKALSPTTFLYEPQVPTRIIVGF